MEEYSNILNALIVEKNVMFYLLFFIMIVAALCILSALITFVVQKTREIGMLKALGATDLQVAGLFLSQGALVGGIGDLIGYGLACWRWPIAMNSCTSYGESLVSRFFPVTFMVSRI